MKTNLLFVLLAFIGVQLYAQEKTVTGTVTSADDGLPLPGANVSVQGTTNGTTTDFDGNYEIEVETGAVLIISYVGFQAQEIPVENQETIDVALSADTESLSEVVVVGYGTAESRDLAGSISNIQAEEINDSPTTSVLQAAQGKLPGVQIINNGSPGSIGQVRIRGAISVLGGADPLYVVDGVITRDISGIDNQDIKSMDVLKDASSTAIYGARGANGVVIITTKSGDGKMNVSLNSTTGFNVLTNKVDMANAQQYAQYTNEALLREGNEPAFTAEEIANLPTTDWMDEITREGVFQKHALSVSGSKEDIDYYLSVGYLDEEGILKNNKFERLNVRLNNTYRLNDNIRIGHNVSLIRERDFRPSANAFDGTQVNVANSGTPNFSAFSAAYRQAPFFSVRNSEGLFNVTNLNDQPNPLAQIENNQTIAENVKILGNIWGEADIADWLTFRSSLGVNVLRQKIRSYGARFTVANESSTTILNQNQELKVTDNDFERFNWDNSFMIDKSFGKHNFDITLGMTSERLKSEFLTGSRRGVPPTDNLLYLGIGEQEGQVIDNGGDKSTRVAYFGRLLYNFDRRYVFNATVRREGSSKFNEDERIKYYPSFGVAWNIDNESFLENQTTLSQLKIRGSYGLVGNDRINSGQFLQLVDFSQYPYPGGVAIGATSIQRYDNNLKWETTKELDLGLDFGFFDGRLSGQFTYYDKKTEDILFPLALPQTSGDDEFITNAGDIENEGIEFDISWGDQSEDGDFSYNIGFNITKNKNELTKINPVIENAVPFINSGDLQNGITVTRTEEGQELGTFWLYKTMGVFQNEEQIANSAQPNARIGDFIYEDTNGDGSIDQEDRQFMGSYQPDFYYGINLSIGYKAWDFSTSLFGNVGGKAYNGLRAARRNGYNIDQDLFNERWTENNPTNSAPAAFNNVPEASDYYLEDSDFLRVNNITLGYTFGNNLVEKLKISRIRIYATAQNPLTFTKYSGYNPELPRGVLDSGLELNAYPTSAKYLLGLNLDF